jgi:hypothetical protein
MGARAALVPVLFAGSVIATEAGAGVYRCTDASGKVLYSNEPCEDQGARTAKTFSRKELRPNSVRLPKAPPPAAEPGSGGPGGLIGSLRQKPMDVEQLIREGDPAAHPTGGVRHPVLEKLTGKR